MFWEFGGLRSMESLKVIWFASKKSSLGGPVFGSHDGPEFPIKH